MPGWLSAFIQDLLLSLTRRLWERATDEVRKEMAKELLSKHVSQVEGKLKESHALVDRLIASQGKPLTAEQKDAIRKERVRLELDLWNTKP